MRLVNIASLLLAIIALSACGQREAIISAWAPVGPQPTILPTVTPERPLPTVAPLVAEMEPVRPSPTPSLVDIATQIDTYLRDLTARGQFRGAVLAATQGRVLVARGYGQANVERDLPNTAQTRFRLASITKPFTALAILQLQAAGKLAVNESVCRYLPNCPPAWQPITLHHLLTHTAGIPNYTDFRDFEQLERSPVTPTQLVARFRNLPLDFAPGTAFRYGNSNYVVLGLVIEAVSGQSYADYLRDNIFLPTGMTNSGYDSGDASALNGTVGYLGPGAERAIPIDTSNLYSAGGLYSTVEDLYRFVTALNSGQLLPAAELALMYTPVRNNYGYGWKIELRDGRRVIYHPGFMSGAVTHLAYYPETGNIVIVLSNMERTNADAIAATIGAMLP
ncbi:MAG: beta-lactamase family protein [Chloroflexus sp.]